jgi:2-oxo-4-hydroxy-4-carboxy-5-ureidoimidazoline decarboxylase
MTLDDLNGLDPARAEAEFRRCCGSRRWARAMAAARPFASLGAMTSVGEAIWASLPQDDWLEAFAAHPQIGEQGRVSQWSAEEQARTASAAGDVRERLAASNLGYRSRFGYIFVVCATGKSPEEMLALLDARLTNSPSAELQVAADEQRKITGLRLAKLLEPTHDHNARA